MKKVLKGVIIPILACLVLLVTSSCGGAAENVVKIGVVGPMTFIQGEQHWYGATLAAEEINAAGGIMIGNEAYLIELKKVDSNEMLSPTDAASAMERVITVDNVDFVVGGFRTEGVFPMQEIAMDNKTIFLGCGSATKALCDGVADDYDRYKYWFRVTPVNDVFLFSVDMELLKMVAEALRTECGIETPKVAILAEKLEWAETIVTFANALIPSAGMEVVGTWRPSDTATDVTAELTAIEDAGAHIIFTTISGPMGIVYAKQWGEKQVPAASVGINVEVQKQGFWDATDGYGNYETGLNTFAEGVQITDQTVPFFNTFADRFGQFPTYNSGTYEALFILKDAIEAAGTVDSDAVVVELEKTDRTGTAGRIVFDGNHDVIWGPGYVTAVGIQWRDGEMLAVWPPADGSWEGVAYEGVVDYELPPWVIEALGP